MTKMLLLKRFLFFNEDIEFRLFKYAIFLLPSAFSLSTLILLISLVLSFKKKGITIFKKEGNYLPLIFGFLIIVSTFKSFFSNLPGLESFDKNLLLIGTLNWIPLIIIYYAFHYFVDTQTKRKQVITFLITGSIPVIITILSVTFFRIEGPFYTLYNTIVWYNRWDNNSSAGLFNNANYAGNWLSIIWPFCLYFLVEKSKDYKKYLFYSLISFSTFLAVLFTNSRNALISFFISTLILLKKRIKLILFTLISITVLGFILEFLFKLNLVGIFEIWINNNINDEPHIAKLFQKFIDIFNITKLVDSPRYSIYKISKELIFERPFFGWGAGTFSLIYSERSNLDFYEKIQHTHNIFIELAYNYGIITSFLFGSHIFCSLIRCFNKFKVISSSSINFDIAWFSSLFTLIIFHLNDITYYDGRISIIFWILISGASSLEEKN